MEQNLVILEQNLKDSQKNIELTKKNISTLQNELTTLEALEKEYGALKQKYENYLSLSRKEIDKNNRSLKELERYRVDLVKRGGETAGGEAVNQLTRVKSEKEERLTWKKEADAKLDKTTQQLKDINSNLKSIASRKSPIKRQIDSNLKRQREYETFIQQTEKKKSQMEKIVQK